MASLFKFFSLFPLWFAHLAGWLFGWLTYALSGSYRQSFRDNVRQAGVSGGAARRAVGAAGQQISELPRLWFGRDVKVQWTGEHLIDAALATGRGIVFLTPHLGCFEITAQAYAQRFGVVKAGPVDLGTATEAATERDALRGRPMTVLFRPPRKAWLTDLVTQARKRPGLDTAPTQLSGVKQLIKALKKGNAVGVLPDQVPTAGQGIWSPFFGRSAYTMTLAVRLALQTQATILIAWGERLSWGRGYVIHVSLLQSYSKGQTASDRGGQSDQGGNSAYGSITDASDRRAKARDASFDRRILARDLEGAVQQVNIAMENVIRTCPQQYLWGYARYKQPKLED